MMMMMMMMMMDDPKIGHAQSEPITKTTMYIYTCTVVSATAWSGPILMSVWCESKLWPEN